jgi:nitrate/nitrite transporter NarK
MGKRRKLILAIVFIIPVLVGAFLYFTTGNIWWTLLFFALAPATLFINEWCGMNDIPQPKTHEQKIEEKLEEIAKLLKERGHE